MTTKNTTLVANFEATPQVASNAHELHGVLRVAQGTVALAAGDSTDNDIVMLAPIPSNASITALSVAADALGGSCTFNVGLYQTNGTVVDEDLYATSVADGTTAVADLRTEAADINTIGTQLWENAGASVDPGGYYYVAATFNATGGTAGDMSFIIHYVVN
jgi:expansin (peptidoglycan-binding protein)